MNNNILVTTETHIVNFFKESISAEYVFHDLQHTKNVVEAVAQIGAHYQLSSDDLEVLEIAAWFHDTGYSKGAEGHEERSASYARAFLAIHNYPEDKIKAIEACIFATKMPHQPQNQLEKILCDADLSHLGKNIYWDRCGRLRQELLITRKVMMSEQEWVDFELQFIQQHQYHTDEAKKLFEKAKQKHIRQLEKQKLRLTPLSCEAINNSDINKKKKKKGKKKKKNQKATNSNDLEIKDIRLGRGVETMYRTTYRTHINLSSIADNKANIMLSINAIIISIILGTLVPSFEDNAKLILPTAILLLTCLVAMVFAILATRPKITEGKFTREDIDNRKANLLFFGNFYNMKLDVFHWGMMEMIKDSDFLYSSMTRDLYFLGVVLAKKYRFLSICYSVFMYGIILSVVGFAIAQFF